MSAFFVELTYFIIAVVSLFGLILLILTPDKHRYFVGICQSQWHATKLQHRNLRDKSVVLARILIQFQEMQAEEFADKHKIAINALSLFEKAYCDSVVALSYLNFIKYPPESANPIMRRLMLLNTAKSNLSGAMLLALIKLRIKLKEREYISKITEQIALLHKLPEEITYKCQALLDQINVLSDGILRLQKTDINIESLTDRLNSITASLSFIQQQLQLTDLKHTDLDAFTIRVRKDDILLKELATEILDAETFLSVLDSKINNLNDRSEGLVVNLAEQGFQEIFSPLTAQLSSLQSLIQVERRNLKFNKISKLLETTENIIALLETEIHTEAMIKALSKIQLDSQDGEGISQLIAEWEQLRRTITSVSTPINLRDEKQLVGIKTNVKTFNSSALNFHNRYEADLNEFDSKLIYEYNILEEHFNKLLEIINLTQDPLLSEVEHLRIGYTNRKKTINGIKLLLDKAIKLKERIRSQFRFVRSSINQASNILEELGTIAERIRFQTNNWPSLQIYADKVDKCILKAQNLYDGFSTLSSINLLQENLRQIESLYKKASDLAEEAERYRIKLSEIMKLYKQIKLIQKEIKHYATDWVCLTEFSKKATHLLNVAEGLTIPIWEKSPTEQALSVIQSALEKITLDIEGLHTNWVKSSNILIDEENRMNKNLSNVIQALSSYDIHVMEKSQSIVREILNTAKSQPSMKEAQQHMRELEQTVSQAALIAALSPEKAKNIIAIYGGNVSGVVAGDGSTINQNISHRRYA